MEEANKPKRVNRGILQLDQSNMFGVGVRFGAGFFAIVVGIILLLLLVIFCMSTVTTLLVL